MTTFQYWCTTKRCPSYHKQLTGPSPSEVRQATGRGLGCAYCGQVLTLLYVNAEVK